MIPALLHRTDSKSIWTTSELNTKNRLFIFLYKDFVQGRENGAKYERILALKIAPFNDHLMTIYERKAVAKESAK